MAEIFVDAATNGQDGSGQGYFFLADHYVAYNWASDRVVDGVHPVSEWGFSATFAPPGPDKVLDAALKGKGIFLGKVYFFKDSGYMRYNWAPSPALETPIPLPLTNWNFPGTFVSGVEAAFNGKFSREGKAYFFKGDRYIRYRWRDNGVDQGYPKTINNMIGMPSEFASGIDAAIDGDGPFVNYGYLFLGGNYIRFNWNKTGGEPFVEGAITPIQGNWNGLVELLFAGKAKAQALAWLRIARIKLTAYAAFLGGTPYPFDQALMETALSTHFHVNPSLPVRSKLSTFSQVLAGYNMVETTLNNSPTIFRYRTDAEAVADGKTPIPPAYAFFNGTINFTRIFPLNGPMCRAAEVLHESVHVFDNLSGSANTHIPEWYVTDAVAVALGLPTAPNSSMFATRYDLMSTANALHNPSSYAAFAQHIFYSIDKRFGQGHPSL